MKFRTSKQELEDVLSLHKKKGNYVEIDLTLVPETGNEATIIQKERTEYFEKGRQFGYQQGYCDGRDARRQLECCLCGARLLPNGEHFCQGYKFTC